MGEWKRVAEILWYSDFASLCTGTNQYGDCGGFEQQRVQHDVVICLCMNTMIVLYGVINHLIQKAGVENFQILKYTVTGKIALLSMSPTNKECLTAVVIAAAFGIVVTLLTAWVFRKRDI